MNDSISAEDLNCLQHKDEELALIDVREEADFGKKHQLYATCIPLSGLEIIAGDLLPCSSTRIVLVDDGLPGRRAGSSRAAEVLTAQGYGNTAVLEGGVRAWEEAGLELYSGVNVPGKAFGEFVFDACNTPMVDAEQLKARIDARDMVLIDNRPRREFEAGTVPGAINAPGVELLRHLDDIAPDPATEVVVTCGGRTRSIIGVQTLVNAGVPHRVWALENGTLGWQLAGLALEKQPDRGLPAPSQAAEACALDYAASLAAYSGISKIDSRTLENWLANGQSRSLYVIDVRQPDAYRRGHLEVARNVPGGQLIQTVDEHLAVRNGRVVLVDDTEVQATVTAAWLGQMGWRDVHVLAGGTAAGRAAGLSSAVGMRQPLSHTGDVWQDACEREDATHTDMLDYIRWEEALLVKVLREGRVHFQPQCGGMGRVGE